MFLDESGQCTLVDGAPKNVGPRENKFIFDRRIVDDVDREVVGAIVIVSRRHDAERDTDPTCE